MRKCTLTNIAESPTFPCRVPKLLNPSRHLLSPLPLPDWHSVSESFHGRMRLIRLGEEEEERGRGSPWLSTLLSGGCLSPRNTKTWLSSSSSSFPQPNSASSLYAAAEERLCTNRGIDGAFRAQKKLLRRFKKELEWETRVVFLSRLYLACRPHSLFPYLFPSYDHK